MMTNGGAGVYTGVMMTLFRLLVPLGLAVALAQSSPGAEGNAKTLTVDSAGENQAWPAILTEGLGARHPRVQQPPQTTQTLLL